MSECNPKARLCREMREKVRNFHANAKDPKDHFESEKL